MIAKLSIALGDVAREAAKLGATLLEKNNAMAEFDRGFIAYAGVVEKLAQAAGRPELADRIRSAGKAPDGHLRKKKSKGNAGESSMNGEQKKAETPVEIGVAAGDA
jgi:hypothetical protein